MSQTFLKYRENFTPSKDTVVMFTESGEKYLLWKRYKCYLQPSKYVTFTHYNLVLWFKWKFFFISATPCSDKFICNAWLKRLVGGNSCLSSKAVYFSVYESIYVVTISCDSVYFISSVLTVLLSLILTFAFFNPLSSNQFYHPSNTTYKFLIRRKPLPLERCLIILLSCKCCIYWFNFY